MSKKTSLLVRDIARLFVKYRIEEWSPILEQLRVGSVIQKEISEAVELLVLETKKAKVVRKPRPKRKAVPKKALSEPYVFSPKRKHALEPLRSALLQKTLLPTVENMREAYRRLGLKARTPSDRAAAVEGLLQFLDSLPESRWRESVALMNEPGLSLQADPKEDYRRWFDVITRDADRSKVSD